MRTHFRNVLARERARLGGVTNSSGLEAWRRGVVEELMNPQSPYALALRSQGEAPGRAKFLAEWRQLITEALDRVLLSTGRHEPNRTTAGRAAATAAFSTGAPPSTGVETEKAAVLILAALHGGSTLSQISQDPWPLTAALDLALGQIGPSEAVEDNDDPTQ